MKEKIKENWDWEQLYNKMATENEFWDMLYNGNADDLIKDFITSLLEQERKDFLSGEGFKMYKDEIRRETLLEVLPEERTTKNYDNILEAIIDGDYDCGFNACRSEIIKKAKERFNIDL
jgi:hypothetical protein